MNSHYKRGKDPLLLSYTYILSSSTVDLLLHLEGYQKCEPIILKMWVKSKFILWQQRCWNWQKRNNTKIHAFEVISFWKRTVSVNLKKFSSNTIFRWYTFGKFYIVKFNYLSERPNEVKNRLSTMLVILEITISLVSIKKPLYQYNPPYTKRVSSHRFLYLEFLSTDNICIIYLHVIEACKKLLLLGFIFAIRRIIQMF